MALVQSFNLKQGIENSLDSKLDNAQDALDAANAGQRQDAIHKLEAFLNAVEAQRDKSLSNEQAGLLATDGGRILAVLTLGQ